MKYLLVLLVVLAVVWFLRSSDRRVQGGAPSGPRPQRGPAALPQDMVECPVCSLHLPRTEALPGPGGQMYCCVEHRTRAGG